MLIAIFEFFISVILVMLAIASALGISVLGMILNRTRDIGTPAVAALAGAGVLVAILLLIPAALFCLLGYGLWTLRDWARIVTMVLALLGAVGAAIGLLVAIFHLRIFALWVNCIRLTIDLAMLWYLNQTGVKQVFSNPAMLSA
jgi:uncharacterized protein YacL